MNVEDVDVWARVVFILGAGAAALWWTITRLLNVQSVVQERFESVIDAAREDNDLLRAELAELRRSSQHDLAEERRMCAAQLAEMSRRIEAQDRRITALVAGRGDAAH